MDQVSEGRLHQKGLCLLATEFALMMLPHDGVGAAVVPS